MVIDENKLIDIGSNVKYQMVDNQLVIVIDTSAKAKASSSGAMSIIASTKTFAKITGDLLAKIVVGKELRYTAKARRAF